MNRRPINMMGELYKRMVWNCSMHGFLPSWLYNILYRLRKHWAPWPPLDVRLPPGVWRNYTFKYEPVPDTRWQRCVRFLRQTRLLSPYRNGREHLGVPHEPT